MSASAYMVKDTFNGGVISRHRTLAAAIKSYLAYVRRWKPYMGSCRASVFDSDGDMASYTHPRQEDFRRAMECDNAR